MVKGMGFDAPFFDDAGELVRQVKPDALFACVPPAFNRAIAEQCVSTMWRCFWKSPWPRRWKMRARF